MILNIEKNRNEIIDLLRSTGIDGIAGLLTRMEIDGFFTAPCSGAHHLACEGGLAEHSLNVYRVMKEFAESLCVGSEITDTDIIICSLLHDLGKMGDFGKPNYVENILKTGQSKSKPFKTNPELLYIGHEVRSIKIASKYIDLTEDQEWAILHHNGLYGDFKYEIQGKETVLYMLLHWADMWVSRVIENEGGEEE